MFMPGQGNNPFSLLQIIKQGFFHFLPKINNGFIPPFSADFYTIIFKIHILNIQADTFRDTDARSQKKGKQCRIPDFRLIMKPFLAFCQLVSILHFIQQESHLVSVQTDNFLLVKFGHRNQGRRVFFYQFRLKKIIIKASQRSEFTGFPPFLIGNFPVIFLIIGYVFQIFFNIFPPDAVQNRKREILDFHLLAIAVIFFHILKENP